MIIMLLRNKSILTIFLFIICFQLQAQQLTKEAQKLVDEANEYFRQGKSGGLTAYHRALNLFLKADSIQRGHPEISYSIGVCYSLTDDKRAALPYLEIAKEGKVPYYDVDFYLAGCYHLYHRFEEAIALLNTYKKQAKHEHHLDEVNLLISNCQNGIELVKHPVDVKISNLGPQINSKYPDYHPSISADEKTIIYISRRDNSTGGFIDPQDNHYYEDIYLSTKVNGEWTTPVGMENGINTASHDGSVGLSADGQELFIYRWSKETHGDLFVSDLVGSEWTSPRNLGNNINSKAWESDVSVTPDKKVIFFTSDRKGEGGRDIYMARRLPNGEYAKPINLGPKINTKWDEDAPFIHPDGKTLYFSSRGHKSMGGYDIFSCTIDLQKGVILTDPVNVGYPINTADDDVFFVWSPDNKRAYFASEREGGYGEKDIYMLERKDVEAALVVLKGRITSCDGKDPLGAKIEVIDLSTQEQVGVYTSNSSSGNYIVILPAGKNYGVRVESPGYLFQSKNIDIPVLDHYKEIDDSICLERLKVGTKIVLRNVFFDVDKATLRHESETELTRLVEILMNNKDIKIQISGHTDSDGNEDHNLKLSEARAHAVVNYLIKKGIEAFRLTFKGFGEDHPIRPNDSPENKQLNRRTEIEIIEYDVK